ncbi:hypothetical protein RhiirA4_458074 [Rhizophagus irregularis]|uniref:Uncharacterized protein n=1 Tax=Rhizophagus irregularis TaxID=588596 RepID=A0A2I1GBD7_9GLOM|nr:hypothetical protein RhiirA4_458074 [Rhizophagus irregularis]
MSKLFLPFRQWPFYFRQVTLGITGNNIADKLAKKGQYKPIEVNIRRFILRILATAKLFHKILPLGSILAIRKPKLYKEMKCIMKCNKKENWNHLFECQAYEVAWQKILEITTKESIIICLKQKQIRCQGEDFIRKVLQNILGVIVKSEKFQKFQHLALEVKVKTYLTIKLQRYLLLKEGISQTDKITSESKAKDNLNQLSKFKVKDNSNQLSNKVKDLQMEKVNQLQKSVSLTYNSLII